MKKMKWILGVVVAALIIGMTGCAAIAAALVTPYGYVYDATTGAGIDAATVTLTDADGNSYSVTTSSTGQYDYNTTSDRPSYGDYTLTVTKTGYAFTPLQVSLSGLAQQFDPVVGVESTNNELLFVLLWDSGATLDVDANLTYPSIGQTSLNTYEGYVDTLAYGAGFTPEGGTLGVNRDRVYSGNLTSSASNEIVLDRNDTDGTGPETISVSYTIPWPIGTQTNTLVPNTEITPLIGGGDTLPVAWVGTLEYYADGNGDNLSTQGSYDGSHPVLYIFDGTTCLGIYRVPDYTTAKVASLARIQVLTDPGTTDVVYYIIYPDVRLYASDSDIRSLGSEANAPLVIKRR